MIDLSLLTPHDIDLLVKACKTTSSRHRAERRRAGVSDDAKGKNWNLERKYLRLADILRAVR